MRSKGVDIKNIWDRAKNGYSPRSHHCMLGEIEFAENFQDTKEDLECREKNAKKRRTMMMWKNALNELWKMWPVEATCKIIDRQIKIMRTIIDADGGRTPY